MKTEDEINYDKKMLPVASQEEAKIVKKRLFKPKIDLKVCKKCMVCVASCPDGCIEIKSGNPTINYSCCKGCLICLRECPYGAITEEKE